MTWVITLSSDWRQNTETALPRTLALCHIKMGLYKKDGRGYGKTQRPEDLDFPQVSSTGELETGCWVSGKTQKSEELWIYRIGTPGGGELATGRAEVVFQENPEKRGLVGESEDVDYLKK